jgi:hypothetical protein
MENPWQIHEKSMKNPWKTHGKSGKPMKNPWKINVQHVNMEFQS